MNAVRVDKINVWYGKFQALKDVSFEIPTGKVAGLLGPNGAGKTTLIKSMLSLLPYKGEIKFFGRPLNKREVGYISENEGLYEWMSVEEYLEYFSRLYGVPTKMVEEVIDIVGLKENRDKKIGSLSKGTKRRVSIARSIIHNPRIIIMDEPLSGLDPLIKKELTELIKKVSGEKTFIISSHQLRDIEGICDWLILIKNGEIVDYGDPESIIKRYRPLREIVFTVEPRDVEKVKNIMDVEGVESLEVKNNTIIVKFSGNSDDIIFEALLKNGIKFNLKTDSLDSIYREVFK